MTELGVIVTDGISQRRVIWVSISPNGIYYSHALKTVGEGDNHTSYHRDGSVYTAYLSKGDDVTVKINMDRLVSWNLA